MAPSLLIRNNRGSVAAVAVILMTFLATLAIVFVSNSSRRFKQTGQFSTERQALYMAESAIELACYDAKKIKIDTTLTDILDGGTFSYNPFIDSAYPPVTVISEYVNGFLQLTSTAKYKGHQKTLRVNVGARLPKEFSAALVLFGEEPLIIENGQINGKVRTRGRIEPIGALFDYELLTTEPPKLNERIFKESMDSLFKLSQKLDSGASKSGQLISYNSSNPLSFKKDSLLNHAGSVLINGDRFGNTIIIEGPGIIESGEGIQISGNIELRNVILVAQGDLSLLDNAKLSNCILLSYKRVYLADKSSFEGSIYSHGTVEIRDQATIQPYTLIYAQGNNKGANQRIVSLEGEVKVSGTIIANSQSGLVYLQDDAHFTGIIFSLASVDIRGIVEGSVIARSFQTRDSDTEPFTPTFRDGKIDYAALPTDYTAPIGLMTKPDFKISSREVIE
ncbi:MAG: hypothetical protein JNL74_10850 [Fibrobacteres bacterium]|nr:hypothetical protein [Fibrobacterota bacterium]